LQQTPLVIVVQDLEAFSDDVGLCDRCSLQVITHFVGVLCEHASTIPLVLVFGVASSPTVLFRFANRNSTLAPHFHPTQAANTTLKR
jgi:hypothetical protein